MQQRAESPHEHSEPLFAGSRVSALEANIMIFQYALRHHLTSKAFSELLLILQVLLPAVNLLPKSLYLLKNFFLKAFPKICVTEHYYCQVCHTPRDPSSLHQCSNELCVGRKFDRFITVPLGPQLQEMMKGMHTTVANTVIKQGDQKLCDLHKFLFLDKSIWFSLKERLLQPNSGNVCDVHDGLQYKKWQCFLREQANVSLLLNTDGVAIFRSSKFSIWPVWIVINELPKSQRYVCVTLPGWINSTCLLLGKEFNYSKNQFTKITVCLW